MRTILPAVFLLAATLAQAQTPTIHAITTLDQPFDVEIPGLEIPTAIAKDSVFLIWGENLGPAEGASATDGLNPPLELGGTTVRITASDGSTANTTHNSRRQAAANGINGASLHGTRPRQHPTTSFLSSLPAGTIKRSSRM